MLFLVFLQHQRYISWWALCM